MEWAFEDSGGNVVSLYDWKSTSLYSSGLPNPDVLRCSPFPHQFHIGGHSFEAAHNLAEWLKSEGEV
jgi:hypothetical protein